MKLRAYHIHRSLETIMDVYPSIILILPGSSITRGSDRLEAERQALATLDHPNIAKVVDAGTTDAGRPFFFPERVQGMPLTRFCEARQLAIAARLTLFRQICLAIVHAHDKGIVHRNLKPNSILVEALDDKPVAKIVDFALVKAVNAVAFAEDTVLSALGTMEDTTLYTAPEQVGPNSHSDARTDIYALGTILFELLTGTAPIHAAILKGATCGEMLQAIQENRLPAPSEPLEGCGALQRLLATRRIELNELGPFIRGELDRIVMKALANEPDRRYQNALALARDLEQIPIHDAGTSRTTNSKPGLWISIGRRQRRRILAGLVLASAAIGAMSIRWPVEVQTLRRVATEPRQAGAQHHAGPPRSDVVGASRFVVGQSLADGNGIPFSQDRVLTRAEDSEPSASASKISIDNFTFHPRTLEVPAGTSVVWVNADDVPHTVRSTEELFRSGPLDTDDVYEHEFSEPGIYEYYCGPHPQMTGKIVVK